MKIRTMTAQTKKPLLHWILRLVPAFILMQSLFFKFSASPVSVKLFTTIGLEPFGRIGIGVAEIIVAILILVPKTTVYGAIGAVGLMIGAIYYHIATPLGIAISLEDGSTDGGQLFIMAWVVLILSAINAFIHHKNLPLQLLQNK